MAGIGHGPHISCSIDETLTIQHEISRNRPALFPPLRSRDDHGLPLPPLTFAYQRHGESQSGYFHPLDPFGSHQLHVPPSH